MSSNAISSRYSFSPPAHNRHQASLQQCAFDLYIESTVSCIPASCHYVGSAPKGCSGSRAAYRRQAEPIHEEPFDHVLLFPPSAKRLVTIVQFMHCQWFESVQRDPICLRRNGTIVLATASALSIKGQCPLSDRIDTSARGKTSRCRSAKSTEI
jgi:hypothetical protein